VTWNPNEIRFAWPRQRDATLKDRLINYIKSGSALKLNSDTKIFYGRFARFTPEWILSGDDQHYRIEIVLDTYKQENLENE
ncbi:hypothetical protein LCGC14_2854090, partial [marine sediment metagenome]